MVETKTRSELEAMRRAGQVVAAMLAAASGHARPGVSLLELDQVARQVLAEAGARSAFLDYHPRFAPTPFPAVICASVNDAALHGIPDRYRLREGDVLSVDAGAEVDGWFGDAAVTVVVGTASDADQRLVADTRAALDAAIAAARPGGRLGDISHAIGELADRGGYGVNADYGGHGIGRTMHEEPSVPNTGPRGRGMRLRPGMVLAIEPWFMAGGGHDYLIDADGWTLRSGDGSRAAHFEHTVAITEDGPWVLTAT